MRYRIFAPGWCLSAAMVWGQNITGTILGTIRDATGVVVQTAKITILNQDNNLEYSNAAGDYVAPSLAAGAYTVKADFQIEPGALAQTVEVATSAPVVNSESATVGTTRRPSSKGGAKFLF